MSKPRIVGAFKDFILGKGTLDVSALREHLGDYIIETGSTLSGTYEKWYSGKLVCITRNASWGNSTRTKIGSIYSWHGFANDKNGNSSRYWEYPHPFIDNKVLLYGNSTDTTLCDVKFSGSTNVRTGLLTAERPDEWNEWQNRNMMLRAEGRWK